jgi:mannose-6-phosphate isomerase-like protein (cupin superfamily)
MEQKDDIIGLDKVIEDLNSSNNYFQSIFNSKGLDVGVLRLNEGEHDTQLPHSVDEVYYVVDGNGAIEIEGEVKPVKRADFIFVPANARHRFILDGKILVVVYFFGFCTESVS